MDDDGTNGKAGDPIPPWTTLPCEECGVEGQATRADPGRHPYVCEGCELGEGARREVVEPLMAMLYEAGFSGAPDLQGRVREVLTEVDRLQAAKASWQTTPAEAKALAEIASLLGLRVPNDAPTKVVDELRRQRHELAQLCLANGARSEETPKGWVERLLSERHTLVAAIALLVKRADSWSVVRELWADVRRVVAQAKGVALPNLDDRDVLPAVSEALRRRAPPVDQPLPSGGTGDAWAELLEVLDRYGLGSIRAACEARRAIGLERYGAPLGRGDGRDGTRDLRDELLDGAGYGQREHGGPRAPWVGSLELLRAAQDPVAWAREVADLRAGAFNDGAERIASLDAEVSRLRSVVAAMARFIDASVGP